MEKALDTPSNVMNDDLQAALGLLCPHPQPAGQAQDRPASAAPPAAALQTELLAPGGEPGEAQTRSGATAAAAD